MYISFLYIEEKNIDSFVKYTCTRKHIHCTFNISCTVDSLNFIFNLIPRILYIVIGCDKVKLQLLSFCNRCSFILFTTGRKWGIIFQKLAGDACFSWFLCKHYNFLGSEFQVFYQLSSWHRLKDSSHNARFWKTKARVDKTFSYPTSLRQTVKFLWYLKNALVVLINSSQNQEASRKERLEWSNQQMKQDGIEKCLSA